VNSGAFPWPDAAARLIVVVGLARACTHGENAVNVGTEGYAEHARSLFLRDEAVSFALNASPRMPNNALHATAETAARERKRWALKE
jgi:hypothetical protein